MTKFKVGDQVIGNKDNPYGISKRGWKGRVVGVREDLIEVCADKNNLLEHRFTVEGKYFDLYRKPLNAARPLKFRSLRGTAKVMHTEDPQRPFECKVPFKGRTLVVSYDPYGRFYPDADLPFDLVNKAR